MKYESNKKMNKITEYRCSPLSITVTKKATTSANNEYKGEECAMEEMCVAMDDLRHHN